MKSIRFLIFLGFSFVSFTLAAEVPKLASFDREVQPLLEQHCNECHHPEKQRGGLDLTRLETMRRGGDELGAAVIPGSPEESPLIQVLTGAMEPAMPDNGEKLAEPEIDLLRRWIAEGAIDDSPTFASDEVAFFEREIRPILATRCFKCHAGEDAEHGLQLTSRVGILTGGARGPAAIPGEPKSSLLIAAIRHQGDLKMPRGGDQLSETQVAAFERWVSLGMPWPTRDRVLAREKQFTISEADRNHWSFRPLPDDLPTSWRIDSALEVHHENLGLTPAPEADRHRLLRRVTYDLIGYPPTSEEIAEFIADASPDAFEKVVNRLLATPQYGWRWGRHWLDYSRNGANGQSNRGPALDSERYAQWVAQCFNEDRPWDWFARVHLAGDQMADFEGGEYSIDQALAAAIPLNGPRTFESITTETFVLMDKLDEGVEFLGRSLMGISLECSRCHDHKFDPISQNDYYALLGFFQSSWFAPVPVSVSSPAEAEAAITEHREMVSELARLNGKIRYASIRHNVGGGGRVKQWQATRIPKLEPIDKRLRELELAVFEAELAAANRDGETSLAADLRTAIAERETKLKNHQAPKYTGFGSLSGYRHFIGGHKSQLGLIKRATSLEQTDLVRELEEQLTFWVEERERWIERSRFGGFAKSDPEVAELAAAEDRIAAIKTELSVNPTQSWTSPKETHLFVRADGGLRRAEDLEPLDQAAQAAGLQFNSNNPDRVYLHPYYIGEARFLNRGDVLYPERLVPRATPVFFGASPGEFQGSGRLELAEWLTIPGSSQAALIARNAVNRAWQNLFGEALCRTPKELGRLGEIPELPEVIDGLAARLIGNGWSMKQLVREIVLSEAYRRSAEVCTPNLANDEHNRYFARQNVRRLEYEPIVNSIAILRTAQRFDSPKERDAAVPGISEYFRLFDGPTVYDLIDHRVASIAAPQALFLMNNRNAAVNVAGQIVRNLAINFKAELTDVLHPIYLQVYQRPPSVAEETFAREFVERRRQSTGTPETREEILDFVTLLLCGNEFLYLE